MSVAGAGRLTRGRRLPMDGDHGPQEVLRFLVPVSVQVLGIFLWAIARRRPPGSVDDPITSPFDHEMSAP